MASTYRITVLGFQLDASVNPPGILKALFPSVEPLSVELSPQECLVTFSSPQTPADLGPLVKVELVTSPSPDSPSA